MWTVSIPDNKEAMNELLIALTYAKGNPKYLLTEDEKVEIKTIYDKYDKLKGIANDSLKGVIASKGTKSAVHSAYGEVQENNRLKGLRSRLLIEVNRCPFCGILPATELDHHLPQSKFELLSVYSRNLIPICHTCNNKKRAFTGEESDDRFIHVYFEKIPLEIQFLIATPTFKAGILSVKFEIRKNTKLKDNLFKYLSFQIERIDLDKRLQTEVNIFLFSFGLNLKEAYGVTKNTELVKQYLKRQANEFKTNFGINDWRTALLDSLSTCEPFCNGGFNSLFDKKQYK